MHDEQAYYVKLKYCFNFRLEGLVILALSSLKLHKPFPWEFL